MKLEPLRQGDVIDVVAPASRCPDQEVESAVRGLREMGFKPRVPHDLFGKFGSSDLFANTDEKRAAVLRRALNAPDSKVVWCVRGGYGALRLMPQIEKWTKPKRAKILLGYSDITTLHAHVNKRWGWPSFHGPLLDRFGRGAMLPEEKAQLFALLSGELAQVEYSLTPLNAAARAQKKVKGPVLGGNLTVLQSGLGTRSVLRVKGGILFLEDTGEKPHRLDRMFTQMGQAGWFKQLRAVVFGDMLYEGGEYLERIWKDVLPRFADSVKIPVLHGLPAGHHPERQFVVPFNTAAVLQTGKDAKIVIPSGVARGI